MKNSEERLTFGEFTLDLRRHALFRGGERLHLTSKPLEALIFLVEQRGRVVSKDELLAMVWKDVAVTEGVLVQAVRQIRRALEDDKENPSFVQTVPREGYRFIADVVAESTIERPTAEAATTPPADTRRRWQVVGGAAVVVFVVVSLRLTISSREARRSHGDAHATTTQVVPLTAGDISAVKPVFSPDGKALVYVSDAPEAQGVLDLFFLPLNGGEPWRLTHQADAAGDLPVYSADGREVVFSRYRTGEGGSRVPDLWKVSAYGGTAVRYISEASGAGFSPDGAWVAYTLNRARGRTLVVSPVRAIEQRREVSTPGFTPRWSPDGRWLAYTTSNPEGGNGDLWIVSTTLAERRQLTRESRQMYGLAWSADGTSIIFASRVGNTYHLRRVSLSDGSIEPLTSGVGEYVSPAVSPDGRQLAFTLFRPVRDLVFARPSNVDAVTTLTHNEFHRWPRLSPSGRHLASVVQRSTADEYLHTIDVNTRESRRSSDVPAAYPSWIDDDRVAYLARRGEGAVEIRQANVKSGENATVARVNESAEWLAMRPGGAEAAFVVTAANQQRIILRELASGRESTLAEGAAFEELRWRSDGQALAWSGPRVSAGPDTNGIFVVEPGRSAPRRVVADGHGPVWSADGSFYFVRYAGDHDQAGIWRMDPATRVETQLRGLTRIDYFDVAGDALVFARSTGRSQIFGMALR